MNARRHVRAYTALLRAYPADHRADYGEAMAQLFLDRLRDEGGGAATVRLWATVATDLVRTSLQERGRSTMQAARTNWWLPTAAVIAVLFILLGLGNLAEDDGGPLSGRILAAAATVGAASLTLFGLWLRPRDRRRGGMLVGVGTLPAALLIVFFWFPPVAALGVLALFVAMKAFSDATQPASPTMATSDNG